MKRPKGSDEFYSLQDYAETLVRRCRAIAGDAPSTKAQVDELKAIVDNINLWMGDLVALFDDKS